MVEQLSSIGPANAAKLASSMLKTKNNRFIIFLLLILQNYINLSVYVVLTWKNVKRLIPVMICSPHSDSLVMKK